MSKWKIEAIVGAVLICVGLVTWWYFATNDARKADAEYKQLVRHAERQAVEIAIIEQNSKLLNYKQQIAKAQQANQQAQQQIQQRAQQAITQPVVPNLPISFVPPVIDPDNIDPDSIE